MSIIVIETLGVFESLSQLAHKKIRYHPRCFSYRNLHITPPPLGPCVLYMVPPPPLVLQPSS